MTTTLKTLNADGSDTGVSVTPLMVTGLDWEQPLNRTAIHPARDAFTRLQLGTPTNPNATLTIILATITDLNQLRTMYAGALRLVLTDTDLGLTWRHQAVGSLRYSPIKREGRLPWWELTVTAEEAQ